jgi:hypothetical protein
MAVINPGSQVEGGTIPSTIYSNAVTGGGSGWLHSQGVGCRLSFTTGSAEYTANGAFSFALMGGPSEFANDGKPLGANGGIQFLTHRREKDGDYSAQWGYRGGDITYMYANSAPFWEQTTPSTMRTFGRSLPQPKFLVLYDHVLQDPTNSNNGRFMGMRESAPVAAGEYARGDRYYYVNPSPGGFEGWVCTTGGAIHNTIWTSGVGCDANTVLRTTAGRFYRCRNGGSSTVEPVHTSGTVTSPIDGVTWTWAADGPPVFKTFGTISA